MKKILYVEDEPAQIRMVQLRLKENGYELISASNGDDGLNKARTESPDLILLDLFLPKISGLDICRQLKKNEATKDIPVIVLTASGVEYVDEQCKDAGANACLKKPYVAEELLGVIKSLLSEA